MLFIDLFPFHVQAVKQLLNEAGYIYPTINQHEMSGLALHWVSRNSDVKFWWQAILLEP